MASAPVDVFQGKDFYVPAFKVKVGNHELREEMNDVLSVSYSDSLADIDSFDLTVSNWDPGADVFDASAFKYSEARTFDPWKDVELWMGYIHQGRDERRRMLLGEITTFNVQFPSGGGSTLTVRGLNLLHRFRTKQDTRAFFRQTDTQIAQTLVDEIAAEIRKRVPNIDLRLDPEDVAANRRDEQTHDYIVMHNRYPILFLRERARQIGYDLSVAEAQEGDRRVVTFNFRRSQGPAPPTYVLEWGQTLASFQPTLQTAEQVAEVTVKGWDPRTKKKIEEKATRADLLKDRVVQPTDLDLADPSLGQKLEVIADAPVANKEEAKRLAKNKLLQIMQGMVEAKGRTVGLPDLVSGSILEIRNVGRFSGTYKVMGTTHTLGEAGYTTDFTARMEARFRS